MAYSPGSSMKGGPSGPGPAVVYQPVATLQPQVIIYGAGGPELPVSPHPAAALSTEYSSSYCYYSNNFTIPRPIIVFVIIVYIF